VQVESPEFKLHFHKKSRVPIIFFRYLLFVSTNKSYIVLMEYSGNKNMYHIYNWNHGRGEEKGCLIF
jgi:hypothetical protein